MTVVLGIDPSLTATGLCRVDLTGAPIDYAKDIEVKTLSCAKPKEKTKREYSRRVSEVVNQVEDYLKGADLVAVESLAYAAKGEAVWVLPWVFGRIIDLCEHHDKQILVVSTTARAKYATGKGNAPKDAVLLSVARRWPLIPASNNNEADALICAAIGARWLGRAIDNVPMSIYTDVMKKVGS